jgi:hypothetical protein
MRDQDNRGWQRDRMPKVNGGDQADGLRKSAGAKVNPVSRPACWAWE